MQVWQRGGRLAERGNKSLEREPGHAMGASSLPLGGIMGALQRGVALQRLRKRLAPKIIAAPVSDTSRKLRRRG